MTSSQTVQKTISWPDWRRNPLSKKQLKLYLSMTKKVMVNAGRAYGKDHVLLLRALRIGFILYDERCQMGDSWTRYGPKVLIGVYGPVSGNFRQLWDRFKEMLPKIPGVAPGGRDQIEIHDKEGGESVLMFGDQGISIVFFSVLRGDSSRGNGFDILVGTEVAYGTEKTLTHSLMKLVRRPNHAGYVMLNSTPRGPGWWWDRAVREARKGKGFWGKFELHEGTWVDNPKSSLEDVEEAQAEKEKNIYTYRRERLAWLDVPEVPDEALDGSGMNIAFTPELINSLLVSLPVEAKGPFYSGSDLAFSGPDELCTITIDHPTGLIVDIEFVAKCNTQGEITDHIKGAHRRVPGGRVSNHCFDANGKLASNIQGELSRMNLKPIKTTASLEGPGSKKEQVQHMEQHFLQRAILIPNPETYPGLSSHMVTNLWRLLNQLRAYRRFELVRDQHEKGKIVKKVFVTYGKPPNGEDDAVDALNMLLQGRAIPSKARVRPLTAAQVWGD